MYRRILLVTILFLFLTPAGNVPLVLAQSPVSVTDEQGKYPLGLHLEVFEDPSGQLTINEITVPEFNKNFVAVKEETPNFGYTTSAHWAKFRLKNNSPKTCQTCQNFLLEIGDPTLDSVEFYLFSTPPKAPTNGIITKYAGDLIPFNSREIDHHNFVFNIPLPSQTSVTVYLRIQNRGSTSLPLTLWSQNAFARNNNYQLFGFGFYYGFIFIMVFYNLFLFLSLREKSYLYYVLFVATLGLYQLSLDGFAQQLLWPNQVWWGNIAILVFIGLTLLNSLNFAGHFLLIKQFSPALDKTLTVLKMAAIALIALSLFPNNYRWVGQLMSLLTIVTVVCGMLAGVVAWKNGYRSARYYLVAWGGILLGAAMVALEMLGLLPVSFITQYGLRIGVFLLVLLLSLAPADRINIVRQEKAIALERLKKINDQLESRVEQRTTELSTVNERLQQDIISFQYAEKLIYQQNDFLYNIIESLANPFYVINVDDYSIQIANSAAKELGTSDMLTCYSLTHRRNTPCDGLEHPCPLLKITETRAPVVVEHIHFDQAGKPCNVEVHAYPIFDENNNVVQMVEYSIDITRRKHADERLRKLSRAVEQSGSTIVITNLNGIIEFVNPAFSKSTGYLPREVIGKNSNILKSGKQSSELYQELWNTVAGGGVWQGELINKKKNGDLYWEYATISPVKDNQGQTTHYLAVKDDISERKQAEEAMQTLNDTLKARLDELSTLNLIVQTVATVTDLETALEIVAGTMTRLLSASRCIVAQLTAGKTTLVITIDFSKYREDIRVTGNEISVENSPLFEDIIKKGQTVIISNPQSDSLTDPIRYLVEQRQTECLMIMPLLSRGKVIGIISIDTNQPGRVFSTADKTLAETVAAQIAGAVANARLFTNQQTANTQLQNEIAERKQAQESLQQRNRELALINQATQAFNSTLKLDQVLQTILDEMHNLLNLVGTSFWLHLPESEELVCKQATGPAKDTILGWRLSPGQGFTGEAAQTGKTIIISDTANDDRHYTQIAKDTQLDIRSIISIPLKTKGKVIGILNLTDTKVGRFTEDDLQLLEPIAAVASGAIENARLFDQTQQAHQRMFDELTLARDIQQGLLPAPNPNWTNPEVVCYTVPTFETGGDFYRYHAFNHKLDNTPRKYAFTVGDVSGKGVSAALLMAASLAQFDATLTQNFTPSKRLAYLDEAITPYTKPRRKNCAMCYVELDYDLPDSPTLHIVNAACIPPYIKRKTGEVEHSEVGGFALGQGLGAEIGYQQLTRKLSTGDLVILTSDGVVEANNAANELLGFEQLEAIIQSGPAFNAKAMLEHLKQKIFSFTENARQHDDFTIMVIGINGR